MWDLIWSIGCSSLIFVVFRLYRTYGISTFHAIVVNYLTAFCTGLLLYRGPVTLSDIPAQPWATGALLLGVLFIVIFNLMARTSQQMGVSVASVATKMSLVIPVLAGLILYGEHLNLMKVAGIATALAAVFFASLKNDRRHLRRDLRIFVLPFLVFVGSGIIDSSIKYLEATRVAGPDFPVFSATLFGFAALTGLGILLVRSPKDLLQWNPRNILGGVALGVPNFFSVYFLLRALQFEGLNSASLFTLNNVSIVMLTTLLGIVLFRETMSGSNWVGIGLAVISILLISFS